MSAPAIAVAVPSHDRPLRLRWLLNALEEQTLPHAEWEVIVAHDSSGPETEELLRRHPLAEAGVLRHLSFPPGPGPAVKRNAAWRAARAPVVVFTDDDCRPPEDWLERMLAAAAAHRGAVVQGRTLPDPDERAVKDAAPIAATQEIEPPTPWGQTCNIAYPRELLESLGGFDETLPLAAGEDTDLLLRAVRAGAPHVAAPEATTYHAVEAPGLLRHLRSIWRWQHLAYLVRIHPELRRGQPLRLFWKRTHPWLLVAVAALAVAAVRGEPWWALLVLPWVHATWPHHGRDLRGHVRSLLELPRRAAVDAAEVAALARGSIRHRTLFL